MDGVSHIWRRYLEDIDDHVPLTTITDEIVRQEVHQPIIERLVGVLDGEFEVVVGLVQLVPEEQVGLCIRTEVSHSCNKHRMPGPRAVGGSKTCLRELKLGDVELLHDLVPEHVGGGKKPAPPAALLVGPGTGLEINGVVEHMLVRYLGSAIQQRGADVGGGQHGPGKLGTGV